MTANRGQKWLLPVSQPAGDSMSLYLRRAAFAAAAVLACCSSGLAQDLVKIGQIEGLTGANAYWGFMPSHGARMAVAEINQAGGFQVAGKTYKLDLIQVDTRGEPREATVQFAKLLEND